MACQPGKGLHWFARPRFSFCGPFTRDTPLSALGTLPAGSPNPDQISASKTCVAPTESFPPAMPLQEPSPSLRDLPLGGRTHKALAAKFSRLPHPMGSRGRSGKAVLNSHLYVFPDTITQECLFLPLLPSKFHLLQEVYLLALASFSPYAPCVRRKVCLALPKPSTPQLRH